MNEEYDEYDEEMEMEEMPQSEIDWLGEPFAW